MRKITLSLADNPRGADPVDGLYAAINRSWANLGLNRNNSSVVKIQHFSSVYEPDRTLAKIVQKSSPFREYSFTYQRFKINRYIDNPIWNTAELQQVVTLGSKELLERIGLKLNLNLTDADFFVEASGIGYTGGSVRPNWRLKARFDSIYWYGEPIVWLHDGVQEPEPSLGGSTQLFPAVNVVKPSSGAWTIDTTAMLGKTIILEGITGGNDTNIVFKMPTTGLKEGSEFRVANLMDGDAVMDVKDFGIWLRPENDTLWKMRHYSSDLVRMVVVKIDGGIPKWSIIGYYAVESVVGSGI